MTTNMGLESVINDVMGQLESKGSGSGVVVIDVVKVKNSVPNLNGEYLVYTGLSGAPEAKGVLVGKGQVTDSCKTLIDYFGSEGIRILQERYEFP